MSSNQMFDTAYAERLTKNFITQISAYARPKSTILGNLDIRDFPYGNRSINRGISVPYTQVKIQEEWNAERRDMPLEAIKLDAVSVQNAVYSKRIDYFADPENIQIHVGDQGEIFKNGIELLVLHGFDNGNKRVFGITDYPDSAVGLKNRPEMAGNVTTAGAWSGAENIEADLISALDYLIADEFYGDPVMLAPLQVKPMLSKTIQYTDRPIGDWILNDFGMPVLYSPFIDPDASKTAFDAYIVDLSRLHVFMSQMFVDAYYVPTDHLYCWDWETYATQSIDPLHNGTEWVKPVVRLSQLSYT